MRQPCRVTLWCFLLSSVCLGSTRPVRFLSHIADKVFPALWIENACKAGKCSDMFLSAALPNRQSNTRYSSVNKWKRRRICKVLFVYDFLGSFIPQEPRIMESVIPEIRRQPRRPSAKLWTATMFGSALRSSLSDAAINTLSAFFPSVSSIHMRLSSQTHAFGFGCVNIFAAGFFMYP